jgi:hypothetical protein
MLEHFATKVESPDQIPSKEHFAVLIFRTSSIHVPGDERSRTNPGHGYPAHDVTHSSYEYWAVKDEKSLKEAIEFLEERMRERSWEKVGPYQAIKVTPMKVTTKVEVEVT